MDEEMLGEPKMSMSVFWKQEAIAQEMDQHDEDCLVRQTYNLDEDCDCSLRLQGTEPDDYGPMW